MITKATVNSTAAPIRIGHGTEPRPDAPEAQRGDRGRERGRGDHQAPLPALSPNSRSRCTGRAVRNRPKISMKITKPIEIDPSTSRWRAAQARTAELGAHVSHAVGAGGVEPRTR